MPLFSRRLLSWLPPSVAYYIYTVLLKPRLLRRMAQSVIKRLIPPTIDFRGTRIALNQDDAIVSGSLALGCYETFVTDVLEALLRPGMTFFDVGANIGIYTALGARIVGSTGRVVAVEPGPGNVAIIQETVRLNRFENVTVAARAAGDRAEQVSLYLCGDNPADHRLHDSTGRRPQVTVETVTLDALAVECGLVRADVVKIDTQGSEAAVFAGMTQLLAAKPAPIIVAEFWPWGLAQAGADPRALLHRITAAGFLVYEIDGDRRTVSPCPSLEALAGLNLERQHVNLLLCQDPQTVANLQVLLASRG
jgi:FkbM family methyltransferase